MSELADHGPRIAAALRGSIAAQPQRDAVGAAHDMLAVAESLAEHGCLSLEDLRQRDLVAGGGPALLVGVLPFGLVTPFDRPRIRRDAYRCAAATGVDEGTALVCVAAALVVADLMRFDPMTTAVRVRQSLLEDVPMALLDRISLLDPQTELAGIEIDIDVDPGAALQAALSVVHWTGGAGVAAVLARLGEAGRGDVGTLAAALAGAAAGECDVPVEGPLADRIDSAAEALSRPPVGSSR